jgi:hypothetical protein
MDTRLREAQSCSRRYGGEKNLLPLSRIEPGLLGRPACSLVAIVSYELTWKCVIMHLYTQKEEN